MNAKQCVVLYNITPEEASSVKNHDIRAAISNILGPVIIDFINRYNFSSSKPKFMIQLSFEKD
jgi:hypothetical protein